jgi:hypothetical protein
MAEAAPDRGFELNPALGDAVGFRRILVVGELPVRRLG